MTRPDDTPHGQPGDLVISLGAPYADAVGYSLIVLLLADFFFMGMIVYGAGVRQSSSSALVIVGVIGLVTVGLGLLFLRKAGPSKLIVSGSSVTLCAPAKAQRRIVYSRIVAVDARTRASTHGSGRIKSREEAHLLVFRLRDGESIEIAAPDAIERDRALQRIRSNLVEGSRLAAASGGDSSNEPQPGS